MPFTIPNRPAGAGTNIQSQAFEADIAILVAALSGTGVVSGCAVTAQGSPDMTVAVAAGTILAAGAAVAVTGGNLTVGAADGTNPRLDLISASAAGVKTITAGTAAASPKPADLPSGHIGLALVYVAAADTAIGSTEITDKRAILSSKGANAVAFVATDQGTGSGPFVALATDGPAVTLIVNTKVRVTISTDLYAASGTSTCYMGCALSGANTVAAAATAMALILEDNGNGKQASRSHVYTGLTPGSTVFTAKYGKGGSGGNAQFRYREIFVELLD